MIDRQTDEGAPGRAGIQWRRTTDASLSGLHCQGVLRQAVSRSGTFLLFGPLTFGLDSNCFFTADSIVELLQMAG